MTVFALPTADGMKGDERGSRRQTPVMRITQIHFLADAAVLGSWLFEFITNKLSPRASPPRLDGWRSARADDPS